MMLFNSEPMHVWVKFYSFFFFNFFLLPFQMIVADEMDTKNRSELLSFVFVTIETKKATVMRHWIYLNGFELFQKLNSIYVVDEMTSNEHQSHPIQIFRTWRRMDKMVFMCISKSPRPLTHL